MRITGAVLVQSGRSGPFAETRPLIVTELDLAEPRPTELLVRIEDAGVCHSDLTVVDGNRARPTPMLLGHEAAGIVEAAGRDVHDVAEGDRVVLTFLPRCGECAACGTDGRLPCERGSAANAKGELLAGGTRLSRDGEPVAHHLGASAFAATAPGGTTVTVGLPRADARSTFAPLVLTTGARRVVGSYLGSSVPERDVPTYADLWLDGRLPVERLVSDRMPLSRINEAMDALADGSALRQLIEFDDVTILEDA